VNGTIRSNIGRVKLSDLEEVGGLKELNAIIERKVMTLMNSAQPGCNSYSGALQILAMREPELFLTRARLELDAEYREATIYFERSASGQLINPAVLQGGKLVPIPAPIDKAPINPSLTEDQELAVRIAGKMNKMVASLGRRPSYTEALKLVASECPNLMARRATAAGRKRVDNYQ